MTYTLALEPADEALIESYAARENLSVPDFIRRTVMDTIKRRAHVPRPKARDEMTDEELVGMIDESLEEARLGHTMSVEESFSRIRRELGFNELQD